MRLWILKVGVAGLVISAATVAQAANITFVGRDSGVAGTGNDSVDRWRTNSVDKPFDVGPLDRVYGSAGYILYGTDVVGNTGGGTVISTNPLTYSSGDRKTLSSLPSYLTLSNNGQSKIATSYNYRHIDDPQQSVGSSVSDVESGAALRDATRGNEVSMLNLTAGSNFPSEGVRLGIFVGTADHFQGTIRLTQTTGGAATVTATQQVGQSGAADLYFFDLTGANQGDVFTLYLKKDATQPAGVNANNNVLYGGMTIDVIPEPASLALVGLSGLLLRGRRRAQR